jgi:perosamine synthetase
MVAGDPRARGGDGMNRTVAAGPLIPIGKPVLGEAELEAVRRPLASGWLTQGPEVAAFEREFAEFVGAPFACAVSNCTTALHLALRAVGVGAGDEVITVSHSFIATANAVRYCQASPVFVDVEPDTGNLDPARLDAAFSGRTRAILAVHQLGMPCDLAAVTAIAARRGVPVIEDAACAAGSEILWQRRWERIGRPHGDIACFSFHPRKVITTGDGGMLTTANEVWDRKFRLWRQHAMDVSDVARHDARQVVIERYTELGYNYRLTDVQAAIGREQLRRLPSMIGERRRLAERYRALLARVPDVQLPAEPAWARSNWQSYCIRLPLSVDQRHIMQAMLDRGVATRRGVMCAHLEPAFMREPWRCEAAGGGCDCRRPACGALRWSERISAHGLMLPLYVGMSDEDQQRVVEALSDALAREDELHHAIEERRA